MSISAASSTPSPTSPRRPIASDVAARTVGAVAAGELEAAFALLLAELGGRGAIRGALLVQ
jgi:hypothetical protein